MRITLERASEFLHLVALLCAMLCAVAVALAARSFAQKRTDECAMYRVLGQSQRSIEMGFLFEFLCVGLMASGLGGLLGYEIHLALFHLLSGLLNTDLPEPSMKPLVEGVGLGATLLLAFGWPPDHAIGQSPRTSRDQKRFGATKEKLFGGVIRRLVGLFCSTASLTARTSNWD
jgi:putative ABC transport system permease protein